jgi:hypothetical protein
LCRRRIPFYTEERQEVTLYTDVMGYFLCCSGVYN